MKPFRIAFLLAASFAMICSGTTIQAGLMVGDYEMAGDGLLTIDSDTGLEWLDWTVTKGESFSFIDGEFGAGGDFEGWRHASEAEVLDLFSKPEIDLTITNWETDSSLVDDAGRSARSLFGYVGSTGSVQGSQFTYGIYSDQYAAYVHDFSVFGSGSMAVRTETFSSSVRGHALVRAVPEPASVLCWLGLGVMGLTTRRRKQ